MKSKSVSVLLICKGLAVAAGGALGVLGEVVEEVDESFAGDAVGDDGRVVVVGVVVVVFVVVVEIEGNDKDLSLLSANLKRFREVMCCSIRDNIFHDDLVLFSSCSYLGSQVKCLTQQGG